MTTATFPIDTTISVFDSLERFSDHLKRQATDNQFCKLLQFSYHQKQLGRKIFQLLLWMTEIILFSFADLWKIVF